MQTSLLSKLSTPIIAKLKFQNISLQKLTRQIQSRKTSEGNAEIIQISWIVWKTAYNFSKAGY